jgi:hypothetical protein
MELFLAVGVCGRGSKDRGPIVRGVHHRLGNFSLRDMIPFGAFRRVRAKATKPRRWPRLRADRPGNCLPGMEHPVPDLHVLDYRMLEGLRPVFGEIYADH